MRAAMREIYAALPWKRNAYALLRRLWTPPRRLTRHLYFEGAFDARVEGETVRLTNHDSAHETEIFWHGLDGWQERVSLRYWIELCRRATTIADVGANVGIYAVVAKKVNPSATVLAFEPVPRFFRRLVENCGRNGLDVRCFDCALSDHDGETSIWDLPADHHYHASLARDEVAAHAGLIERRIAARRLESVVAEHDLGAVDLLKIDVEGWEPQVIEGMGRLLGSRPTILAEIKSVERAARIEALVSGMGYLFYEIDESGDPVPRPRLGPSRKWNWLLCQPSVAAELGLSTRPQ